MATYADRFFTHPPAWFDVYLVMEAGYHLPLSLWAVRELGWRGGGELVFFFFLLYGGSGVAISLRNGFLRVVRVWRMHSRLRDFKDEKTVFELLRCYRSIPRIRFPFTFYPIKPPLLTLPSSTLNRLHPPTPPPPPLRAPNRHHNNNLHSRNALMAPHIDTEIHTRAAVRSIFGFL